jgi:GNAT superfamily N-acetyltransferase
MKIISIKDKNNYLTEYIKLCSLEWGESNTSEDYIKKKKDEILNTDKVISILGLIDNRKLIGFISLFKYDGDERRDLTPWYATMYVKDVYRNKGYSKILNKAILDEASRLGFNKIYLKSELVNYYEKFGAKHIDKLNNGENLYYIEINKKAI